MGLRALVAVAVIVRLKCGGPIHFFIAGADPILGAVGAALCVLGIALAIWACAPSDLAAYFIYGAAQEQKNMLKEFPNPYPAYMKRTKIPIPFVF